MLQGATALNQKLDRFAHKLDGIAKQVAQESVPDVAKAVTGSIGDTSLSGWRRGNPIPITGAYKVTGPGVAEVTPTPRSRGPMRVLESGRQASTGARVSAKTGRALKSRRASSTSRGRGTWTNAASEIESNLGKRAAKELRRIMSQTFNKGVT